VYTELCPAEPMYFDELTETCFDCMANCEHCWDSESCDLCIDGYSLQFNELGESFCGVQLCPELNMFMDGNGNCQYCMDDCLVCANGESCQTCDMGFDHIYDETTG